jgi:hypothetical protein
MWFYISAPESPIANDRDALNFFASVWGVVKPEASSENIVKRALVQAIESAEQKKDKDYGYDAFSKAVRDYLEKNDTTDMEMIALINRATDRGILRWMPSKAAWFLVSETGVEIKRICHVTAMNIAKPKEALARHLLNEDEDLTLIQGSVEAKPIKEKVGKKIYIPKDPTEDFFRLPKTQGGMPYAAMKSTCTILGIDSFGKDKAVLAELLIDYRQRIKKQNPMRGMNSSNNESLACIGGAFLL